METILDKIVAYKRQEIAEQERLYPTALLEQSIYFETPIVSLVEFLARPNASGIIAEFKRQSPSKGKINPYAEVEAVSIGYMQAGASGLSVLTDLHFFGGKLTDLSTARNFNYAPILNKNFVLNEYQIIQAKSIGADVILLIAACLTPKEAQQLAAFAKSLGMEVLLEIHKEAELEHYSPAVDLIGINNRNLQTFEVNLEHSMALVQQLPTTVSKIAESGIRTPEVVVELRAAGFDGFLIGEQFMKHSQPQQACAKFIQQIKQLEQQLVSHED